MFLIFKQQQWLSAENPSCRIMPLPQATLRADTEPAA
jgi:hypothetical protein